jgi:hypothetical protein
MIEMNIKDTNIRPGETPESCYYVPLVRYTHSTGRESTIPAVDELTFGHHQNQRVALLGLGGVSRPT